MFCSRCGAELPDGAKFCNKCGEKTLGEKIKEENRETVQETETYRNKNLMYCPDCEKKVSINAETCPNCGCRLRKKKSYAKIMTVIGFFFNPFAIISIIAIVLNIRDLNNEEYESDGGTIIGLFIALAELLWFLYLLFFAEISIGGVLELFLI